MQGNQVGFESSLQQHLDTEQRRAVLEAIGGSINPDSTLGEIIDAAEALGWSEKLGDLSLADLAEALLAPNRESVTAASEAVAEDDAVDDEDDEDEDDDEDDDDGDDDDFELEIEEPAPSRRKVSKAAAAKEAKGAAAKKKIAAASKKMASKKAADAEPMKASKKSAKKASASASKKMAIKKEAPAPARAVRGAEKAASPVTSKKTAKKAATAGRRKPTAVDVDDRMSLDEAAEFFLPVVEELGEATMQALEEQTSVSRRKLRFHVGQLVKHGYLERHGMGRGTYYTRR